MAWRNRMTKTTVFNIALIIVFHQSLGKVVYGLEKSYVRMSQILQCYVGLNLFYNMMHHISLRADPASCEQKSCSIDTHTNGLIEYLVSIRCLSYCSCRLKHNSRSFGLLSDADIIQNRFGGREGFCHDNDIHILYQTLDVIRLTDGNTFIIETRPLLVYTDNSELHIELMKFIFYD